MVLRMSTLAKALVPDLTGQMQQAEVCVMRELVGSCREPGVLISHSGIVQIFDRLDLTTHSFMEKNVHLLMECIRSLDEYVGSGNVIAGAEELSHP